MAENPKSGSKPTGSSWQSFLGGDSITPEVLIILGMICGILFMFALSQGIYESGIPKGATVQITTGVIEAREPARVKSPYVLYTEGGTIILGIFFIIYGTLYSRINWFTILERNKGVQQVMYGTMFIFGAMIINIIYTLLL